VRRRQLHKRSAQVLARGNLQAEQVDDCCIIVIMHDRTSGTGRVRSGDGRRFVIRLRRFQANCDCAVLLMNPRSCQQVGCVCQSASTHACA
jgi:hypothetical protein